MEFTYKHRKRAAGVYASLTLASILIGALVVFGVNADYFAAKKPPFGAEMFKTILFANVRDYLKYLVLYILSPIMLAVDTAINSFQITIGFRILGGDAFSRLMPHSLIELPNILLYHFLSFYQFIIFIKNKSSKKTFISIRRLKWIYVCSFILVILGALIEGYLG
ncbi:hypothetical protein AUQ39_09200 [Lacticaseibacillus casei]|uniref:Stage II sporulation protein M n=1 Tax=Lacticaseibacillus zeae TaxID=57037 RepID=A0A5R8LMW9_LACZE|nr:stage II sporulation protein M [Lacticaseibacillus zeae]OLS07172.1 hypothetical protein AUQ39_09200 [Lacticaseibacillus casei]QVI32135.1 hypothetical protein KG087_00365 [Lacticaseibacillus zeae]TLF38569.1 hypothetical protein FEI14_14135 [Lacticaseibacillus zeae]